MFILQKWRTKQHWRNTVQFFENFEIWKHVTRADKKLETMHCWRWSYCIYTSDFWFIEHINLSEFVNAYQCGALTRGGHKSNTTIIFSVCDLLCI